MTVSIGSPSCASVASITCSQGPVFSRRVGENLQKQAGKDGREMTFAPALIFSVGLQRTNPNPIKRFVPTVLISSASINEPGSSSTIPGASSETEEIYLNSRTARQLGAKIGDQVVVSVALPSAVPRDSLLGKKDSTTTQIPFTVSQILSEDLGASRFGIRPDQQIPLNAFVPLRTLQTALDLEAERPSRDNPQGSFARINSLLASSRQPHLQTTETAAELTESLHQTLQLNDLDLRIVPQSQYNYLLLKAAA